MRSNADAAALKDLSADCAGENERSGESSGKMTAAADIVESVVADKTCKVCMTGTGSV